MKKYLLAICVLALGISPVFAQPRSGSTQSSQGQTSGINWYTNYSEAASAAQKGNKPLLLFFTGSDWCGWCKKMDQEVFSSADFIQSVGNEFVFVDIDFPMNKPLPPEQQQENNRLKQKYGVTGYPTIIILDSSGNFVAETGYRPGGGKAYAEYLKQLIK